MPASPTRNHSAFTLVDVMMGATILVVGLVGLIEAILIGSEMQATARRQTTAAQIVSNEIELLKLKDWATVQALKPTPVATAYSNWNSATPYHVTDMVNSGGNWYRCIIANTNQPPPNAAYWSPDMIWSPSFSYHPTDVVKFGGIWYRCISPCSGAGQSPPSSTYWAVYSGPISNTGIDSSATYALSRTVSDGPNGLIEVTFIVTWITKPSGNPVSRTYSRIVTTYFGKYGLNLTYQRT